jgi:hypothetical protein
VRHARLLADKPESQASVANQKAVISLLDNEWSLNAAPVAAR